MCKNEIYDTALYARLSREDGAGSESNSIANQVAFMQEYVRKSQDIRVVSIRKDDGYSGIDFDRPDFGALLEDIKHRKINCVVVKDLSRFGRNHLEVAEYIEHIFPFLGVRFIAINDNYDSLKPRSESDHILIPFKNLVNESYLRDISVKVRSSLDSKRRQGQFIANFAPYGYKRDPDDRHRLVIDAYAAMVVKRIFAMKIGGMSHAAIAQALNDQREPVPLDYNNMKGIKQYTPLKKYAVTVWSYVTVDNILKNKTYVGTLLQGKTTTPSYKVKKVVAKPEEEWVVHEDAHAAIISKSDLEIVAKLLRTDTRTAPGISEVPLFSGMIYCHDCKSTLVRKSIPSGGKKYIYYVCTTNKKAQGCSSHSISEVKLMEAVSQAIRAQIKLAVDTAEYLKVAQSLPQIEGFSTCQQEQLTIREQELGEVQEMRRSLYEDYRAGVVPKDDFMLFNTQYVQTAAALKVGIEQLQQDILQWTEGSAAVDWLERYTAFEMETSLNRQMLVSLVEQITVCEDKKINITFCFQDKIALLSSLFSPETMQLGREA